MTNSAITESEVEPHLNSYLDSYFNTLLLIKFIQGAIRIKALRVVYFNNIFEIKLYLKLDDYFRDILVASILSNFWLKNCNSNKAIINIEGSA